MTWDTFERFLWRRGSDIWILLRSLQRASSMIVMVVFVSFESSFNVRCWGQTEWRKLNKSPHSRVLDHSKVVFGKF
jgi:hypothetical protein